MRIKYIITLIISSFLLHAVWENAQAPLYAGYQSFLQHLPICSIATLGDVVITVFALGFMRLVKQDEIKTSADFLALTILGFIIAIAIEQNALLVGKWSYASAMPLVPGLKVGLMPVLQMTLLLPLSFYLTSLLPKWSKL